MILFQYIFDIYFTNIEEIMNVKWKLYKGNKCTN